MSCVVIIYLDMINHEPSTIQFIKLLEDDKLKKLVIEAIELSYNQNSNPNNNPVKNLDDLYDFLDWSVKCMPWNVLPRNKMPTLYLDITQSINFFWFLFGQELDELKDFDYYLPTLEYHEPIASWIRDYSNAWGDFLNTEESWNDDYYRMQFEDEAFGMTKGWYGNSNIWKTYNEFFSRHLIDPSIRPIGDAELVSPADSAPAGYWPIDENGFVLDDVRIKTHKVYEISNILGEDTKYKNAFNGGTLTHTFLNVHDYHRYHFPIDGKIVEMKKIKGVNAVGGHTTYNPETKLYTLDCNDTSWQIIETRDSIILDTEFGLVAILPIGMSQICSCNFEGNLKVGDIVHKGDPLGYFLFGGSDIVMLFQKNVEFIPLFENNKHMLMGENYANLKKR